MSFFHKCNFSFFSFFFGVFWHCARDLLGFLRTCLVTFFLYTVFSAIYSGTLPMGFSSVFFFFFPCPVSPCEGPEGMNACCIQPRIGIPPCGVVPWLKLQGGCF